MSHEILTPTFQRNDERGLFQEVLNDGHWESFISARMNPQTVLGNHYHKETLIFLYVTKGSARIATVHVETLERDEFFLKANQGVILRTYESHAIHFPEESEIVMLKSRRYDPADPDTFPYPVED